MGKDGFLFNDLKELKTEDPKIVILSESYAFGNGLLVQATFAEQLDRMLGHTSVINLSFPGYTSYKGYKALHKKTFGINPADRPELELCSKE